MMTTELLDVQPCELKFTFELKKQSLCSIQLGNKSDHYVAFKVKTTSPKKYCVRPNAGIIKPKATCDFTVTMQAQRVAPPDLQCKDKFLILSTVIPFGTTEEEITSDMVAEDVEGFETYKDMDESRAVKDVEELKPAKDVVELKPAKVVEELKPAKVVEELKPAKDAVALNLTKDFDELKLKLNTLDSKLKEAELTIMKLTEDRSMTTREKNMLKHELELLRRKNNVKRIMVGFPLFYVCMVALISLAIGYYIHP
ncbi:hypothetical protein PRUPE_1G142800 [Prunus persica]|uniref:Uncharacterized protein n=1 Tax=Prunus persica TaxID=3760 RepID=M5XE03_PRUPE|nr:hypothetical protein PRUPE_1G142800 [Prunus persica]